MMWSSNTVAEEAGNREILLSFWETGKLEKTSLDGATDKNLKFTNNPKYSISLTYVWMLNKLLYKRGPNKQGMEDEVWGKTA